MAFENGGRNRHVKLLYGRDKGLGASSIEQEKGTDMDRPDAGVIAKSKEYYRGTGKSKWPVVGTAPTEPLKS
jgi:hypothetical protein